MVNYLVTSDSLPESLDSGAIHRDVSKGLCPCRSTYLMMDDAARVRDAAMAAVDDIDPESLRAVLHDQLADASMSPAVLVLQSASACEAAVESDSELSTQAAAVQLIYEGLRLTRRLAQTEPWAAESETELDADVEVLAADVFVSRGFYLLARTDAADRAVEVVRAFGRNQTVTQSTDTATLEADIFALAVTAGTTAVGRTPTPNLLDYARELATDHAKSNGYATSQTIFSESTTEQLAATLSMSSNVDDRVYSSATDQ
jgi:hypothetical protein